MKLLCNFLGPPVSFYVSGLNILITFSQILSVWEAKFHTHAKQHVKWQFCIFCFR